MVGGFAGYNVGFMHGADSMKIRLDEMEKRMGALEQRLMGRPGVQPSPRL